MYCAKCGVKLADSEECCPLCGTRAYHPDIERTPADGPYPKNKSLPEAVNPRGLLFALTVIFIQPIIITVFCDLQLNRAVTWSGYAAGGVLLGYIILLFPLWFKKPNPVIFVPIDFVVTGAFLLYISLTTGGGWFLSFAFPAVGILGLIITAIIAIAKYVRRGYLYLIGGTWLGIGVYLVLLEFFIRITFFDDVKFLWSFYPFTVCFVFGIMFIVIAIVRPLRESLRKIFFL